MRVAYCVFCLFFCFPSVICFNIRRCISSLLPSPPPPSPHTSSSTPPLPERQPRLVDAHRTVVTAPHTHTHIYASSQRTSEEYKKRRKKEQKERCRRVGPYLPSLATRSAFFVAVVPVLAAVSHFLCAAAAIRRRTVDCALPPPGTFSLQLEVAWTLTLQCGAKDCPEASRSLSLSSGTSIDGSRGEAESESTASWQNVVAQLHRCLAVPCGWWGRGGYPAELPHSPAVPHK
jgi:hypothetical protein